MSQTALKASVNEKILISTNPAQGNEVLGEVPVSSEAEISEKVSKARQAQEAWQDLGIDGRVGHIRALIALFIQNRDELVRRTSMEMGMPKELSEDIVDSGLRDMAWQCDNAVECLKTEILFENDNEINELIHEPYGVMACIVAWNFPFGNFAASVSSALLAGNTAVMKYSEEVPLFSQYLESLIAESDLPDGVVNFIYGDGQVGAMLADQEIDLLSFTGSSQTGRKLYQKAAERLLPVSLELGGSSPGIIFEDCDLTGEVIEGIFWERFANTGQFCDGLKRLIVHNNRLEECVEKLVAYAGTKTIGDPLDEKTELGPLVAERQVVKLEEQIKDALDKGAQLRCGGRRPEDLNGSYYEPTILTNILADMRVWAEEVFGPALAVIGFDTYEEAIRLANDTEYGLSGYVFTGDQDLARKALSALKAGAVSQGGASYHRSQNPFGGYKSSGIGRQRGKAGFHEASQIKVMAQEKSIPIILSP